MSQEDTADRTDLRERPEGMAKRLPGRIASAQSARVARGLLGISGFLIVGVLWVVATDVLEVPPFILPPPQAVVTTLVTDLPLLLGHAQYTGTIVITGYLLAIAVAVPLALVLAFSRTSSAILYPLIVSTQAIPKVALAPLILIWLGFGTGPGILVTLLICFFPIIVSTVLGLKSLPIELVYLAQSMGAGRFRTFMKIRVPYALPYFFSGLKVAITLAVVGAVVGEFVGSNRGLGYFLLVTSSNVETDAVFADLIILSALAVILFVAVEGLERLLVPTPRNLQR